MAKMKKVTKMTKNQKNNEFHIPFVKNLLFICSITIFCMIIAHIFIQNSYLHYSKTYEFMLQKSQISTESK